MVKKDIAKKMLAHLDNGKISRKINAFVGKHHSLSSSKVLSALDRWSFRNSPQFQEWLKDA